MSFLQQQQFITQILKNLIENIIGTSDLFSNICQFRSTIFNEQQFQIYTRNVKV